jgi:hypothetical protein
LKRVLAANDGQYAMVETEEMSLEDDVRSSDDDNSDSSQDSLSDDSDFGQATQRKKKKKQGSSSSGEKRYEALLFKVPPDAGTVERGALARRCPAAPAHLRQADTDFE